ncbi:ABC transporter permease [Wenxinia saemankumensis]|uniref:Putative spermidine/putrescine transport system permease protein n=1 Tax=Wenxinia saemankumensis TaxID=1447782 RepID=A0A1M6HAH1_9RHOB|nr:ABC transporter permease [Wenxinia saemankumensis]SHJ19156.1 putative spermidine/putrescine transport system permease protein [Wenxinia saemankumensis]
MTDTRQTEGTVPLGPDQFTGPTPDNALRDADRDAKASMVAADGTPLKASLARSLRRQKLRALMLVAPLLIFVLVTFIAPIADMLFRSVQNEIVVDTLPRTVAALQDWDYESGEVPGPAVFDAMTRDMMVAVERKEHTRLGSRLNYELTGISSLLRQTGRDVEDIGEVQLDAMVGLDPAWEEPATWAGMLTTPDYREAAAEWAIRADEGGRLFDEPPPRMELAEAAQALPLTADAYTDFARTIGTESQDSALEEEPWPLVYMSLVQDLRQFPAAADAFEGDDGARLAALVEALPTIPEVDTRAAFLEIDEEWADPQVWGTIKAFSPPYTPGYFLSAADLTLTPDGVEAMPEDERIYRTLFLRTIFMSLAITFSCILLGYPVAWLLANLPARQANVLMILVLLPFWTSLLVRTSAWKVLLQQQGVINDILVWLGLVGDANRLVMINNVTGTIIAMTHILLPFMILPLYSVMKTIPPSYVRAAKSLGATDFTAFRRVYFPQSVPGIGAGSILVFILAIGYYITPEIVGGTKGVFISNRIAYHISTSLNWGLAAALGSILLVAVLILYWAYDRIIGIDNVKLGG